MLQNLVSTTNCDVCSDIHGCKICNSNWEVYMKIRKLLKERLAKGNMMPFYKINDKMQAWMKKYEINQLECNDWLAKYYEKTSDPKEYTGIEFCADHKIIKRKQRKYILNPTIFYLEFPCELVSKSLVLGCFP